MITGTDLNEAVSGIDRPDADAMTVEELNRLVREAFGRDSETIIAAYRQDYPKATPFGLYATIAASEFAHPGIRAGRQESGPGRCAGIRLHLFVADPGIG